MSLEAKVVQFCTELREEGVTALALFAGTPGDMGRYVVAPSRDDMGALLLIMSQTANELVQVAQEAGTFDAMAEQALTDG
jgi:hypothetical protein